MVRVSIAVAGAALLLLAGCASPAPQDQGGGGNDSTSAPDTGDSGIATEIPATFPQDIPLIDGEVGAGIDVGTGWSVVIKVDDLSDAFADASSQLKSAGFTADTESDSGSGAFGQYQSDEYTVQLTAGDSPDYGPSLTYLVVIK